MIYTVSILQPFTLKIGFPSFVYKQTQISEGLLKKFLGFSGQGSSILMTVLQKYQFDFNMKIFNKFDSYVHDRVSL